MAMTPNSTKALYIPRMSGIQKRSLLTWLFGRFQPGQLYSFDDFVRCICDSPHAHLTEGVDVMRSREFAHMMVFRMKKSVGRDLYRDQFPDHYISICGWETVDLVSAGEVPEALARRPGGAFPNHKGVKRNDKWEYPTGFMWGPISQFSNGDNRDAVMLPDPNDEDEGAELAVPHVDRRNRDHGTLHDLLCGGLKGQQWERAKGELRAMIHLVGGLAPARHVLDRSEQQWEELEKRVKEFIKGVEDDGLHE